MQDIWDVDIPAVVLIPIILLCVAVWIAVNYNAKSSVVRRAEFVRLQRLAVEEQERAEREYEREYSHQRQGDYRRRESGENDYRKPAQPQPQQDGWRQLPEAEIRRRTQVEDEEYNRQAEADFHRRRMLAEADERRRRELAAEDEKIQKRKAEEREMERRIAEERERERRIAELEAHLRREAEEDRKRKLAEDEANRKRQQEEEARKHHEVGNKYVHTASNLHCLVCKNPTKRRCSRCKSVFYWYVVGSLVLRNLCIVPFISLRPIVDHFVSWVRLNCKLV